MNEPRQNFFAGARWPFEKNRNFAPRNPFSKREKREAFLIARDRPTAAGCAGDKGCARMIPARLAVTQSNARGRCLEKTRRIGNF
jgi:hypothetical protein